MVKSKRSKPEDKNVADKAGEIAKNIWLAGVGAYGKAVDDAQNRLEKAGVEPPKLFKDLVKAGAALEEEARASMDDIRSAGQSVEERISRVRESFTQSRYASAHDIAAINKRLDAIGKQLDALQKTLEATAKPAPKAKSTRRRAATTATQKTRAKAKTTAKAKTRAKAKTTSRRKS